MKKELDRKINYEVFLDVATIMNICISITLIIIILVQLFLRYFFLSPIVLLIISVVLLLWQIKLYKLTCNRFSKIRK